MCCVSLNRCGLVIKTTGWLLYGRLDRVLNIGGAAVWGWRSTAETCSRRICIIVMYFVCANTWFYNNHIIVHGMCSIKLTYFCVLSVQNRNYNRWTRPVIYGSTDVTAVATTLAVFVIIFNTACCLRQRSPILRPPYLSFLLQRTNLYAPIVLPLCFPTHVKNWRRTFLVRTVQRDRYDI